jgi:SAM-dependent methyltransferase
MTLESFLQEQLPPPPARVLEVGCGQHGGLATALSVAGWDMLAIDPMAPPGEIFRRLLLDDLASEDGPFDAVVAVRSLHHIRELDGALAKIVSLLRPEGVLAVDEFGWDLLDEPTARQYDLDLDDWREEHADLHGFDRLRNALDARFSERHFAWGPYFSRHLDADPDEERELIAAGNIRPLGFRYVGA